MHAHPCRNTKQNSFPASLISYGVVGMEMYVVGIQFDLYFDNASLKPTLGIKMAMV